MKNTGSEVFTSLKYLLGGEPANVVVVTHENPDGDAIGSSLGLAEVLHNFGHEVNVIVPNDYPSFLQWFISKIEILIFNKKKRKVENVIAAANIMVCLDFNDPRRVAKLEKQLMLFPNPKVLIDHHPEPISFCDYTISEPSYCSTAELVFVLIRKIGLDSYINYAAAEALYTGIMTDTGSFSHNILRPDTFVVVAKLMEWGINIEKIQTNVYHTFSESRMKLLGYCLNKKMEIFPEYRSAVIYISRKELEQYNFKPGDTEGFVNFPLSVNNIIFSALFIEKKDIVKASFRSKGTFPANKFSRNHFDGGGHLNAAGGESKLTLKETVEKYKRLINEYKNELLETII